MRGGGLLLLASVALWTGCEVVFEPIAPSDRYFSLSGYLDASADTQWVRVEPVAPDLDPRPGPLDATVTLEHPASGTAVAMGQRVRTFPTGPAHLFWTTADVAPGGTYRVVVRRPDGATTRATVAVPAEAAEVTVVDGPFQCPTVVYVRGASRLADVQARYAVSGPDGHVARYRFSKVRSLVAESDGSVRAAVYYGDDAAAMGLSPFPAEVASSVTVAVGTDDWPDPIGLDLETALVLTDNPRIENGVGFVGGTVTTTLPFTPGLGSAPPPGQPALPCVSRR